MKHIFFIGRAERVVLSILIIIALAALGLYALSLKQGRENLAPAQNIPLAQVRRTAPNSIEGGDSIYKSKDYVGPPEYLRQGGKSQKFQQKQVLDLNKVDSLTLIRIPGIGPAFAKRILTLRERLGGYYTVLQLQEVYGIDEEKFLALRSWFKIKTPPKRHQLSELKADELPKHLYLSWEQQRAMNKLINRHGKLTRWSQLMREACFSREDSIRLSPYFVEGDSIREETQQ